MVTHIYKHTVAMRNRRVTSKHTDTVLQEDDVAEEQTDTPAATCADRHTPTVAHTHM